MGKVLITLHDRSEEPIIEQVMHELDLQPDELDVEYGVQLIDPAVGDYVILVDEEAARRIAPDQVGVSGPYSNPRIEPFGPPES